MARWKAQPGLLDWKGLHWLETKHRFVSWRYKEFKERGQGRDSYAWILDCLEVGSLCLVGTVGGYVCRKRS